MQVRALCVCDIGLITASRDKTIKVWKEVEGIFEVESTLVGHEGYVTAVAYIPPGLLPGFEHGALVSGKELSRMRIFS
jgi:WD40 repeat protein